VHLEKKIVNLERHISQQEMVARQIVETYEGRIAKLKQTADYDQDEKIALLKDFNALKQRYDANKAKS